MSAITPQTELRLIKCPIEQDNLNQMNFADATAQYNYFNGLTHLTADRFTYQRKDNIIRYPEHIDNLLGYNYVMYQNEAYSNKWFYAFITNMEYVNDKMTHITIKTDVFQTWQFDLIYKKSFVEREHVNNDTAGLHTVPEGLETGDYIGSDAIDLNNEGTDKIIFQVLLETEVDPNDPWASLPTRYGGVYSGTEFLIFDLTNAGRFIKYMDDKGKKDYIINIFMYNGPVDEGSSYYIIDQGSIVCEYTAVQTSSTASFQTNLTLLDSKPTKVGYYTPVNKKLLTYPYCYLLANNNGGTSKVYKYEDFDSSSVTFARISTITVGGSIMYYPMSYKMGRNYASVVNYNEGFIGAKYPTCAWSSDGYINWLTQTSVNREYEYKKDAGQIAAGLGVTGLGLLTGNPMVTFAGASMTASGVGGTINDVMENVKAKQEHQIAPLELSGNASAGDVVYAHFRCKPIFTQMSIKEEYAKIIDNYFSMFGYQINEVKLPNITGRRNWNYVKTSHINLEGDIPEDDLQEIKNIFNKGFTIWHNPSTYLDYSQSNPIV